ncbi:hypothetical protein ABIF65_002556 [Bradyrhizobium japonicum]|jgi:hypothetical protein|uniref:hypothetical protein n=1 Tax=Bradyrhizobium TaxID=374 RepID=UPI00041E39DD|nr:MULTISPECIES: hypothetical protein [Bradyrhizobium]MBR1003885.1 hypothetical protein [Bradyrhizobium liaoningense]MBR1071260.1 hypothetical protein [Bradyrhizobium liaoningense]MCP1742286.1 hypothetical protein [Bradyrhizobium japonicum]MCP1780649.1 hypothetical protein [Bradyrhizobium japonicum]MCP1859997.1 hypothetical protein [Bradyrhizobium japonicum]
MARNLTSVDVKIVNRTRANGDPFAELLHTWVEGGRPRKALSRVPWPVDDTPHNRAFHIAALKTRQARA